MNPHDDIVPDAALLGYPNNEVPGDLDARWLTQQPQRQLHYNPRLDPRYAAHGNTRRTDRQSSHPADDDTIRGGPLLPYDAKHPANLISSLCTDGLHRPALDIDVPMVVVPSSTEGHYHLYFPTVALDDERYAVLMAALAVCGIVTPSHAAATRSRGRTLLRPPTVRKTEPIDTSDCEEPL